MQLEQHFLTASKDLVAVLSFAGSQLKEQKNDES
jgi:hypothetical protein